MLNGAKIFISGADRAQYGIVFARTDASKGRAGITCFIIDADTPGFHVRRVVHTLRSSSYATELEFKDCGCRITRCWARSTRASPSPTTG